MWVHAAFLDVFCHHMPFLLFEWYQATVQGSKLEAVRKPLHGCYFNASRQSQLCKHTWLGGLHISLLSQSGGFHPLNGMVSSKRVIDCLLQTTMTDLLHVVATSSIVLVRQVSCHWMAMGEGDWRWKSTMIWECHCVSCCTGISAEPHYSGLGCDVGSVSLAIAGILTLAAFPTCWGWSCGTVCHSLGSKWTSWHGPVQ